MRVAALVLFLVSGCSLYFEHPSDDPPRVDAGYWPDSALPFPDAAWPTDDAPWPREPESLMARCEDGLLYVASVPMFGDDPGHGAGRVFGSCGTECRSAAALCNNAGCTNAFEALCEAPISEGATCPLDGAACRSTDQIDCPSSTACSEPVQGSTCTCVNNTYQCTQATPARATQAAMVGKWRGTVTTPGFAEPYSISLWIYPDGSYWPECTQPFCNAFFYGGDGASPQRKITVLSTSDNVGSWADITIDFGLSGTNRGLLSALVVDGDTLRFTYSAAWLSCGQPFDFALRRD